MVFDDNPQFPDLCPLLQCAICRWINRMPKVTRDASAVLIDESFSYIGEQVTDRTYAMEPREDER